WSGRSPVGSSLCGDRTAAEATRPDYGGALDGLSVARGDAPPGQRRDAYTEPRFDTELPQRLFDQRTRLRAHCRRDDFVAVDDDDADVCLWPENGTQARRHFGGHLDAGETAAADDHCIAGGRGWPIRQGGEVAVERDRVVELIDREAVLGKSWYVRLEPLAAGSQHQAVVAQRASHPVASGDRDRLAGGIDHFHQALFVTDVDGLEHPGERCHHG